MTQKKAPAIGGVVHVYQRYDPTQFPSPTKPPPDLVAPAFEHALAFGRYRELTEEELARAVELDPSQIDALGPSIEHLRKLLEERKQKILSTYESDTVQRRADEAVRQAAGQVRVPKPLRRLFRQAVRERQIYLLERLYFRLEDTSPAAGKLTALIARLADQYAMDELAARYEFTGHEALTIPRALEVKEELEQIDELLRQLEEAAKTARIGIIDLQKLSEFVSEQDMASLEEVRQQVENLLRELAERQGLQQDARGTFQLTPQAFKIFQGQLLQRIFSNLQAGRTGRHHGRIEGDGSVELPATRAYQFGDSLASMDLSSSIVNNLIRQPKATVRRLHPDDIEVHRTRNTPKCATAVIMDMSGSMRYDAQYINVKRMALALQGLITTEYPGDVLRFIEMYTFGKLCPPGEIINLLPKPVTLHDPWVRLRVDMSRDDITESQIHPHFTNIQHALRLARQNLVAVDTPNRQVVLITDGLPTAHFEESMLYLLYPPDPRTEEATLREGRLCRREGIVINVFLVPSWSQSPEDIRFAYRLAEATQGRVIFTAGRDLDRFVVWDYLDRKREILG
ncbi:MAG: hypothetical protein KatS3mg111_1899 [Pirellulaceae bacterium]|nr:MAG: hypothetical protein KatS3mg111_1899 [Pirellulaceae bacterium]